MTKVNAAGNVDVPAYLVLCDKGYEVQWDGADHWTASKGESQFAGEGPIELLGVVSMYEHRGEQWQAPDDAIDRFLEQFPQ